MAATNRLLIVDDEPVIARLIEIPARSLGYEVLSINDTDQFEEALQQLNPTIIFLDIFMPGRDGMELLGHLVASNYSGKVVVKSGSDPAHIQMSSAIAKMRGLTLAGTLAKPFRRQAVTELLASLAAEVRAAPSIPAPSESVIPGAEAVLEGSMPTTTYRCYFLNGKRIDAVEAITCDDDAAALLEADKILAASHYRSIEIWAGVRKVAILSRDNSEGAGG